MDFIAGLLFGIALGCALVSAAFYILRYLANRKFQRYLRQVQEEGRQMVKQAARETSELSFRDKSGELCVVKIVIDHNLKDNLSDKKKADFRKQIAKGDFAGNLQDLMGEHKIAEDAMGQVEEFVFSIGAVQDMRSQGIEPDELVRRMLRAAGRIT